MQEWKRKELYLQQVTDQIRNRRGKCLAEEELSSHIEDQAEAYIREGMTPEAAEEAAVRQMGDPVDVGTQLDHLYRPKPDWKLMALTAVLLLLGILVQYGVSGNSAWFTRQLLETEAGIALMVVVYFMDYTILEKAALWLWAILTGLLGLEIGSQGMLFGSLRNGQYGIYPLLMLYVPLFAGVLYRLRGLGIPGMLLGEGLAALPLALALLSGSMTSVFELTAAFLAMLIWAFGRDWFRAGKAKGVVVLLLGGLVLAGCLGLRLLQTGTYGRMRLAAAFHPERFAEDAGYMAVNARKLLAGVTLAGSGNVGNLTTKDLNFADQSFLYVLVRYGLVAGIGIVCLLGLLLIRMFVIAFRQKNQLGALLIFGSACLFLAETVIYLGYNLGFMLLAPRYLPFFSRAGMGIIPMCVIMGLCLCVFRNTSLAGTSSALPGRRYRIRIEKIAE